MRHVVTLYAGAIVGEIALLKDGAKRMATVRAAENVDLLVIDKASFLELDKYTLAAVRDQARYNAACARGPTERTTDDLRVLQQRTSMCTQFAKLDDRTHLELCRVMRYRKVRAATILVRKNTPVEHLHLIISGTISTYATDPKTSRLALSAFGMRGNRGPEAAMRARQREAQYLSHFLRSTKPVAVKRAGQALGEDELLLDNAKYTTTAITLDTCELMEIDQKDFDRILKAERNSQRGMQIEFLTKLSCTQGCSAATIRTLLNAAKMRTYTRDEACLAHPPDAAFGTSSFSHDLVYIIYTGEAQLYAVPGSTGSAAVSSYGGLNVSPSKAALGEAGTAAQKTNVLGILPVENLPPPPTALVERHLGGVTVPVATLSRGEVISDNLFVGHPQARWYLRSANHLELLAIPRKEWSDGLRTSALNELHMNAVAKAAFFEMQLNQALVLQPAASPSVQYKITAFASRPRSAAARLSSSKSVPGLPGREGFGKRELLQPPGSFLAAGLGHGVVVPPRAVAERPKSAAGSRIDKNFGMLTGKITPAQLAKLSGSRSSPRLGNTRTWLEELEMNPAYRKPDVEKRKPRVAF